MSWSPWQVISTSGSVYAGIVIRRATGHKSDSSIEAVHCEWLFTVHTVLSDFIKLISVFIEMLALASYGAILCCVGNISSMNLSIKEVPRSKSTAKFSTILSRSCQHRLPLQMDNVHILSLFITSRLAVSFCGHLIDMVESFRACDMKSLSIEVGLASVPRKLATVSNAFRETTTEFSTR